jgi:GT2 family glycosyltransferase
MSSDNLTVGVIICTRDRPEDLRRCLESLRLQSTAPQQIIVVSGSTGSLQKGIVAEFSDLPIRVVESYEHNISVARNKGLETLQTDIVLFIDDDAKASTHWVQAYIESCKSNRDAWAFGGDVYDARCQSETLEFSMGVVSPYGLQRPVQQECESRARRGYYANVKGCNFAIRRQPVLDIGGFDPFFGFAYDESDLIMSIHEQGGEVVYVQRACVDHLHTPGHYRGEHPLDRDWRVEYASHTMFMLKHTPKGKRWIGRAVVYRRLIKLMVSCGCSILASQMKPNKAVHSLNTARRGIRYALRQHRGDTASS